MTGDRNIPESEIIAALTERDRLLDEYVLIGGDMPGFVTAAGEQSVLLIEDQALAEACVQFLKKRGAPIVAVVNAAAAVRVVDDPPVQRTGAADIASVVRTVLERRPDR